jgi:hypothetical protein
MNDLWQEGYNVGHKDGDRDGYARGWHEAMRVVDAEKPKVPKIQTVGVDTTSGPLLDSDS